MESTTLYFKSMTLNQSVVFTSKKKYKLVLQRKFLSFSKDIRFLLSDRYISHLSFSFGKG